MGSGGACCPAEALQVLPDSLSPEVARERPGTRPRPTSEGGNGDTPRPPLRARRNIFGGREGALLPPRDRHRGTERDAVLACTYGGGSSIHHAGGHPFTEPEVCKTSHGASYGYRGAASYTPQCIFCARSGGASRAHCWWRLRYTPRDVHVNLQWCYYWQPLASKAHLWLATWYSFSQNAQAGGGDPSCACVPAHKGGGVGGNSKSGIISAHDAEEWCLSLQAALAKVLLLHRISGGCMRPAMRKANWLLRNLSSSHSACMSVIK